MNHPLIHLLRLACLTVLLLAAGCAKPPAMKTNLGMTLKDGRAVQAVLDGQGFITSNEGQDTAIITFGGGKHAVVEKERFLIEEKEQAKIPAGARKVEVTFENGKLTVTADGQEVYSGKP